MNPFLMFESPSIQYEWNTVFAGRNWNAGETIGKSFAFMPIQPGVRQKLIQWSFPHPQSSSFVERMGHSCRHPIYLARSVTRYVPPAHVSASSLIFAPGVLIMR